MLYIITLAVYGYLFWRMFYLPYRAYIEALCAFDEIENEQMSYFSVYKKNDPEIDARYDKLISKIRDPGIFIVKQMFIHFFYCILFSIFCLWVFFRLDMITLDGVRIIGSIIFAACLFILSVHLSLIDRYKKQAKKIIKQNFRKKKMAEEAELQSFLRRTSADYGATETD